MTIPRLSRALGSEIQEGATVHSIPALRRKYTPFLCIVTQPDSLVRHNSRICPTQALAQAEAASVLAPIQEQSGWVGSPSDGDEIMSSGGHCDLLLAS